MKKASDFYGQRLYIVIPDLLSFYPQLSSLISMTCLFEWLLRLQLIDMIFMILVFIVFCFVDFSVCNKYMQIYERFS